MIGSDKIAGLHFRQRRGRKCRAFLLEQQAEIFEKLNQFARQCRGFRPHAPVDDDIYSNSLQLLKQANQQLKGKKDYRNIQVCALF